MLIGIIYIQMDNINNFNFVNFKESKDFDSLDSLIMKESKEKLISKRKEFINNYRKKQRLLSLIESKRNLLNDVNNNNKEILTITINDIKDEPDPVSRILIFKEYIQCNLTQIDLNFVNSNLKIIKYFFSDFKKILFDYKNNNIEEQININRHIIYCCLCLLFDPESNPLIDEFDYEFLLNINSFCFYYITKENNFYSKENLIFLHLYILFLLNNLIAIYPDVELLKQTIDIKNYIILFYKKYFNCCYTNISLNKTKSEFENKNSINLNICDKISEFFEFTFLKLIENCVLHLNLNDINELIDMILNLIYYNNFNNEIKLLIYSLETLINTEKVFLLLNNNNYNKFLLDKIEQIIHNFNYNNKNGIILIEIKLFFELYLEHLYSLLEFNNVINSDINFALFLQEKIIIFFKNYYFQFFQSLSTINKGEITINELKLIIKITKIFCFYFNLRNITNSNFITIEQKNDFQNILYFHFISKDNMAFSLCDILINTFTRLAESKEKHLLKICNLIISIFKDIYPLKNLEYKKNILYIKKIQLFLIENYSLHMKLFQYLNLEKYFSLVENMLELI